MDRTRKAEEPHLCRSIAGLCPPTQTPKCVDEMSILILPRHRRLKSDMDNHLVDGEGGILIEVPLEVNVSRSNELGLFDRTPTPPTPSKPFQPDASHILTKGSSLGSKLQSRLKLVRSGRQSTSDGCLIVLDVNFKPKSYTGALRFRDAVVTVTLHSGKADNVVSDNEASTQLPADSTKEPRIVKWHPEFLEGPAKNTLESYNISLDTSSIPPAFGAPSIGPNPGYSMSRERPKRRIIHGTIEDEEQRILEWKLEENKSAGDGIPPSCKFAFVTLLNKAVGFSVLLGIRAITVAGLPVVGKNTGAIYFPPGEPLDSLAIDATTENLWSTAIKDLVVAGAENEIDLAKVDLSQLTQAEELVKRT